jgi:hypothetical protein
MAACFYARVRKFDRRGSQWDNRLLFSAARQKLLELPSPVRLDISVGGKDDFGFDQDTIAFAKLLDELKPAWLGGARRTPSRSSRDPVAQAPVG